MKSNIIFLDFDGVITTLESKWKIDISKIELINKLCNNCNAKIVVTSSWKHGSNTVNEFINYIKNYFLKHKDYYLDNDYMINEFINNIIDITHTVGSVRGEEIQQYINDNGIINYVILDDDSDMLDEQLFHFVQTDAYEGITDREYKLCYDILESKEIINPIRLNSVLTFRWRLKCRYPDIKNDIETLLRDYKNRK